MSLNFIYGQIEGSDDRDVELFVPLDGQQRLTDPIPHPLARPGHGRRQCR